MATPITQTLHELRGQVDTIDEQILMLIKARITLAQKMGKIKSNADLPLRDEARESEILARIKKENRTSEPILPESALELIYRQLMSSALAAQQQG